MNPCENYGQHPPGADHALIPDNPVVMELPSEKESLENISQGASHVLIPNNPVSELPRETESLDNIRYCADQAPIPDNPVGEQPMEKESRDNIPQGEDQGKDQMITVHIELSRMVERLDDIPQGANQALIPDNPVSELPNEEECLDNIPQCADQEPIPGEHLTEAIKGLSHTTRENLESFVCEDLLPEKAVLKKYHQEKWIIVYNKDIRNEDILNTMGLCVPQTETASKVYSDCEAWCAFIAYLKENNPPDRVVLDESKVTWEHGQYREISEYVHLKNNKGENIILGEGSSGIIYLIMDKKGIKHAMKSVDLCSDSSCSFLPDEVRCWRDLNGSGHVPKLYMIRLEGKKIHLHMEVLDPAKDVSSIFQLLKKQNPKRVKLFSLYFFLSALKGISVMHNRGWVHNDIHGGNVMLKSDMTVKFIDFGKASRLRAGNTLYHPECKDKNADDVTRLLLVFFRLYTGHDMFADCLEMEEKYSKYIKENIQQQDDKVVLKELMDGVLKVTNLPIEDYMHTVQKHLDKALKDAGETLENFLETTTALLFPETLTVINKQPHIDQQRNQIRDGQVSDEDQASGLQSMPACQDETIKKLEQDKLDLQQQLDAVNGKFQKLEQDNLDLQQQRDAAVAKLSQRDDFIKQLKYALSQVESKNLVEKGGHEGHIHNFLINPKSEANLQDQYDSGESMGASAEHNENAFNTKEALEFGNKFGVMLNMNE